MAQDSPVAPARVPTVAMTQVDPIQVTPDPVVVDPVVVDPVVVDPDVRVEDGDSAIA